MDRKRFYFLFLLIVFSYPSFTYSQDSPFEARYYDKLDHDEVNCLLCPRRCVIRPGARGFCRVRENRAGVLYSLVYGKPCSAHIDPIEKKPLFHVLPGARAFSIATVGCNLRCQFCQNWQIAQASPEDVSVVTLLPEELIRRLKKSGAPVIAYTYTEPTIYYEYMFDIAKLAHRNGILNVMHSAGFINEEPLRQLCPLLDAANIDLKGFNNRFYSKMTLGNVDDVLRCLKVLKEEGVWIEITNLILPGLNDDPGEIRKMCEWIYHELGDRVPIHFSRFWPMYKLRHLSPTPIETLKAARAIAQDVGLKYVYIGNVGGDDFEDTFCPHCGEKVIDRAGYVITAFHVVDGRCQFCGGGIDGVWSRE